MEADIPAITALKIMSWMFVGFDAAEFFCEALRRLMDPAVTASLA